MAASAEYELEKRVERLELFPVELEKGELESLGPLPGRGGSFCPGPSGVCTGMFLLPGSRPLSASHSHTDPAQPRLPPPPPLSCALPCARALPCAFLRFSVPGGACGLGPQARGALRRCSLSCDLKRSREMQGRGETWWIQVAGEEGCASKASFFPAMDWKPFEAWARCSKETPPGCAVSHKWMEGKPLWCGQDDGHTGDGWT